MKTWINIPKSHMVGVHVTFLCARRPHELDYVTEIYKVMNRIQEGELRLERERNWDVGIQCKFHELYLIE